MYLCFQHMLGFLHFVNTIDVMLMEPFLCLLNSDMAMWTTLISLIDPTAGGAEEKTAVETASAGKVEGNGEYDTTLQSIGSTLEVDYVKNPTPLYKKVQQEDWTAVANFLDAGYCTCS